MPPPLILRLNAMGDPVRWIRWQDAVCLYSRDMVAWTAGDNIFTFYGGTSHLTGLQSSISINSIIAVKQHRRGKYSKRRIPPLNNRELFLRDSNLCLYCGVEFSSGQLTRDHIIPLSRGGLDLWANVVTACKACNAKKGNHTPEEARMPLLAVPYVPNWAEFLALCNRKILVDQMEFLKTRFTQRDRRLHLQ